MAPSLSILALLALLASHSHTVSANLLIKGGTVVNHDRQFRADVLVEGGHISDIGPDLDAPAGYELIDATGYYVMPGGIDPHTHLDMPFMGQTACDDFYQGQAAALAGGTTMHIDFALPVSHDLWAGYETWRKKAERGCMDYSFHMAVTSWSDKVRDDMSRLAAEGINSFKFFMAYKGALQVSDEELVQGFVRCKELGALPMVHAENGDAVAWGQTHVYEVLKERGPAGHPLSRPAVLEGEATGRAIRLAEFVNVPLYVVHVMSRDAMEQVAAARQRGARVIGEPVASGISVEESVVWHPNFTLAAQYVMSPPIRSAVHRDAIKQALAGGVLHLVATDHASFNSTQKAAGKDDFRLIPNGVHGLEERLHVVWSEMVETGLITPSDFVRITSTTAAQVFNIYPRKGHIGVGSDADIILFDPTKEHTLSASTHHHCNDLNIYEGKRIKGKVEITIRRGEVVWRNDKLTVKPGTGRFLPLPLFGPLYDGIGERDQQSVKLSQKFRAQYSKSASVAKGPTAGKDEL